MLTCLLLQVIGTGLAGALAFLKDRGELSKPVEWAGRTNDSKKVNVSGAAGWNTALASYGNSSCGWENSHQLLPYSVLSLKYT